MTNVPVIPGPLALRPDAPRLVCCPVVGRRTGSLSDAAKGMPVNALDLSRWQFGITTVTLWLVLLLGVAAAGAGTLGRVPLAVITLTALAAFEAVSGLPGAALQVGHARSSARRITEVLDAPDPIVHPDAPAGLPSGPVTVTLRGAQVRYDPDGPAALDGIDPDLAPGRRVALVGPGPGSPRSPPYCSGSPTRARARSP